MPENKGKEPQSYGSRDEWLTGKTGEVVNPPIEEKSSQRGDFYESRRESETSSPNQGGNVSPQQLADNVRPSGGDNEPPEVPTQKVTDQKGGAKRDSFFKDRDY